MSARNAVTLRKGMRVRFTANNLGASERDALHRVTADRYDAGDVGIVAFPHPNRQACRGWWYVAVDSKVGPARTLYVAVAPGMVERATSTTCDKPGLVAGERCALPVGHATDGCIPLPEARRTPATFARLAADDARRANRPPATFECVVRFQMAPGCSEALAAETIAGELRKSWGDGPATLVSCKAVRS